VTRDQPWNGLVRVLGLGPEVGVALGLVDHAREAEHVQVVAQLGLEAEYLLPRLLVAVAVDDALHEGDGCCRQ
jgi:hypothetical protein